MRITISEGIQNLKLLRERHAELVALRDKNAVKETRFYGASSDKEKFIEPVYDVKKLDQLVTRVACEIRKLDASIKKANTNCVVEYEWDDAAFGQVE